MKVAVGYDDLYPIVEPIIRILRERNFELVKVGPLESKRMPWSEVGLKVGELVSRGEVDFGIVICYTGTGVSIAANKMKGVRAALCVDAETARGARLWNDANVLALSARITSDILAREIIEAWLSVKSPDPSESENIEIIKQL